MLPFPIITPYTIDTTWIGSSVVAVDDSIIRSGSTVDLLNNQLSNRGLVQGNVLFPFISAGGIRYQNSTVSSSDFGYLGVVSIPGVQSSYTSWSLDGWMNFGTSFSTGDGIGLLRGYDSAGYINLVLVFTSTGSSLYLRLSDNSASILVGTSTTFSSSTIQSGESFHIAMNSTASLFELFVNGIKMYSISNATLCLRIRDKVYNAQPFNNTPCRPFVQYYQTGMKANVQTFNRVRIFSGTKFSSSGFSLSTIYSI